MAIVQCQSCGKDFNVIPARLSIAKFCSYACRGKWRSQNFKGINNPNYRGGHDKTCACGNKFWVIPATEHKKFCSKPCADKYGFRYSGEQHPNYRQDSRRKNRSGSHNKWANAVISRDAAICQHCGVTGVELHAHHIKSYRDYPELRFDVNNGLTLCFRCHWAIHTASNENAVNSVNPLTVNAEGNTEPSLRGNLLEGVTTRGRAYRRWVGVCAWCGNTISKRLSDTTGKKHLFCNKSCAGKFRFSKQRPTAVISSTSAAPEREDIV
jgi:hypothetical protein